MTTTEPYLLQGVRIVEIAHPLTEHAGRLFAGLGAEVLLIEPPGGGLTRRRTPLLPDAPSGERASIPFLARNLNKHSVVIDPDDPNDISTLAALVARSTLVLDADSSCYHHSLASMAGDASRITVTDELGLGTSSIVGFAASGGMACSGWPEKAPANAPSWLALDGASIYAAMMGAVALFVRQRHGVRVDYQVPYHEAATRTIAPWSRHLHAAGVNVAGQGVNPGRSGAGPYPVFETTDGWVKLALATPRQWGALHELLDSPDDLADEWLDPAFRTANLDVYFALCAPHFADRSTHELFREGQKIGLTISPLNTLNKFREDSHALARQLFVDVEDPDFGVLEMTRAPMVSEPQELVAAPAAAPALGSAQATVEHILEEPEVALTAAPPSDFDPTRPLAGLRLLQLGSGAVVPEACSDFALLGADILRVESMVNQDFLRRGGVPDDPDSSSTFNQLNLGVRSLTVDMRAPEATDIVAKLVTASDAVVENMRAPVVQNWGFDYVACREIRDDVVCLSSQGFGRGPYGRYQSFGPNLAAYSGAASQWAHPDDPVAVGASIPHPDHVAGKQAYVGLLAAIIRHDRTGNGCFLEAAQVEAPAHLIADRFLAQRFSDTDLAPLGNRSDDIGPHGCYPCRDDEWLAIAIETDEQWADLARLIDAPWAQKPELATATGRIAERDHLDKQLSLFTTDQRVDTIEAALRGFGIPASRVVNSDHMAAGPGNHVGGIFAEVDHPVTGSLAYTGMPVLTSDGHRPEAIRSPLMGEHTDEIVRDLAGCDARTIADLRERKILGF